MTALPLTASAVLIPAVGSEFVLSGAKLQTRLLPATAVWSGAFAAALIVLLEAGGSGVVALTIFWGGAFAFWFGVRSHLESSILLRMLALLRRGPMSDSELVAAYTACYGKPARLAELCRAGLVSGQGNLLHVTAKGKAILAVVSRLT